MLLSRDEVDTFYENMIKKVRGLNRCLEVLEDFCYDENERMQNLKLDTLNLEIGLVNVRR